MATRKSTRARTITHALQDQNIVAEILPGLRVDETHRRTASPINMPSEISIVSRTRRKSQTGVGISRCKGKYTQPEKSRSALKPNGLGDREMDSQLTQKINAPVSRISDKILEQLSNPLSHSRLFGSSADKYPTPVRHSPQKHESERSPSMNNKTSPKPPQRKRGRPRKEVSAVQGRRLYQIPAITVDSAGTDFVPQSNRVIRSSTQQQSRAMATRTSGLKRPSSAEQDRRVARVKAYVDSTRPAAFPSLPIGVKMGDISASHQEETKPSSSSNKNVIETGVNNFMHARPTPNVNADIEGLKSLFDEKGVNSGMTPDVTVEISMTESDNVANFIEFHAEDMSLHPSVSEHLNRITKRIYPEDLLAEKGFPRFRDLDIRLQVELIQNMTYYGGWQLNHYYHWFKLRFQHMAQIAAQIDDINHYERVIESVEGQIKTVKKERGNRKDYDTIQRELLDRTKASDERFAQLESGQRPVSFEKDYLSIGEDLRNKVVDFVIAWGLHPQYLGLIVPGREEGYDLSSYRNVFLEQWNEVKPPSSGEGQDTVGPEPSPTSTSNLEGGGEDEAMDISYSHRQGPLRFSGSSFITSRIAEPPEPALQSIRRAPEAQMQNDGDIAPRGNNGLFTPSVSPPFIDSTNEEESKASKKRRI